MPGRSVVQISAGARLSADRTIVLGLIGVQPRHCLAFAENWLGSDQRA